MKYLWHAAAAVELCLLFLPVAAHADYAAPANRPAISADAVPGGPPPVLSSAIASPDIPRWTYQTTPVANCAAPPVIDGGLDDPCWTTATHHAGFYPVGSVTPIDPADQTEMWICADKTRLYIAFHCLNRRQSDIHAVETNRDGDLSHDDYVGIDIDSQNARHGFSSFQVSARGAQFERFEGGTPDNIAWMGDWKAAARQVPGGWTVEISIPFPLLHYVKGSKQFGMDFFRNVSHSSTIQCWPYLPPEGVTDATEGQYLSTFTGISPPYYTRRPTFLAYSLATAGQGSSVKEGLDIKYPLTTTLTAVGTIRPDFQTIEQSVSGVNFSYTEKFVSENRPFFAEGQDFLPSADLYYSRRIGSIDGGIKVVGKQGNTTIGLLDTENYTNGSQSATAFNLQQDIDQFSTLLFGFVRDQPENAPLNTAAKMEGSFGWQTNRTRYSVDTEYVPTWNGGQALGSMLAMTFSNTPIHGRPGFNLVHTDVSPEFLNNLGYLPEPDIKGNNLTISQSNSFDRGWIQNYYAGVGVSSFQHHTGGFFHSDVSCTAYINTQSGLYFQVGHDISRRNESNSDTGDIDKFQDHTTSVAFGWGKKTLYQQGGIQDNFGKQAGQRSNYFSISQNVLVARSFYFDISYGRLNLGDAVYDQTLSSITYRLNEGDTVGAKARSQSGNTNVFLSYSRHIRSGNDIYLIVGDPNSSRARGLVTAKFIHVL